MTELQVNVSFTCRIFSDHTATCRRVYRSETAQHYYYYEPLTGLRTVCFAFATDIRLLLAASKAADGEENSRVWSKYDQIILLSDNGMIKMAGIFIYNKTHAHMPPPDLLCRTTGQETAYVPV